MSQLTQVFDKLKTSELYNENAQVLTMLLHSFTNSKKPVTKEDLAAINSFIFLEMVKLTGLINQTADYKAKSKMFDYEDKLVGLFMLLTNQKFAVDKHNIDIVNTLVRTVANEQVIETAVHDVFKLDRICKSDIDKILDIVKPLKDEYQRGEFYQSLLNHKADINKLASDSKDSIAEYINTELIRYLKNKDKLTEDEINNLEIAADLCRYFINGNIGLLKELLQLKYNNIRYYAIESLLTANIKIEPGVIAEMAGDLTYADLTYSLLKQHNQADLFPKEFRNPEYLAKSDMVHWLIYPTELGKAPDAIELIGTAKVKGEIYYIFKYKSDSDCLGPEDKNEWLIGWSSRDGGTFSHFDKLALFEQKNPKKTIKVIKKKLLG